MPTTGECEGGCQDGWTGIDCTKANVTKSGKQLCPVPGSECITILQLWYWSGFKAI